MPVKSPVRPTASTSSNPAVAHTELVTDTRRIVSVEPERVVHVSSTDFPGHYPGEDHSWNLERFKQNLKLKITLLTPRTISFDLIGVDASIANAFRRIMIAEVPTIAIEHVYVWNNTSVIVDEVLSHRLGQVPLNVDPELFEPREPGGDATDRNTLVFKLDVTCSRIKPPPTTSAAAKSSSSTTAPSINAPYDTLKNGVVTASQLVWEPQGEQAELPQLIAKRPAATNGDIVLAKLRPGQAIEMEMHAVKGVGKDHAKFSPVATATYRLLPTIILSPSNPVPPHLAEKFASCFSPGVIRVDPKTKAVSVDTERLREESVSREVFRHPEFEGMVKLGRARDWFIFNVETESAYAPERILPAAIRIMRSKIKVLKAAAQKLVQDEDGDVPVAGDGMVSTEGRSGAAGGGGGQRGEDGDVVMMDS